MEDVSRRRVLGLSAALLGGKSTPAVGQFLGRQSEPVAEGWVTKGDRDTIADRRATIDSFRYKGSSLCNDGDVFQCRTCHGVEFFLLVPSGSPEPTVGEAHRVSPTGKDNACGNFQVELFEADSCGDSTGSSPKTTENTSETETTTTETTTTDTTTETTTDTTDTTATETTTDTTTTTDTPTTDTPTEMPTDDG
jgi:hypothetical protein